MSFALLTTTDPFDAVDDASAGCWSDAYEVAGTPSKIRYAD